MDRADLVSYHVFGRCSKSTFGRLGNIAYNMHERKFFFFFFFFFFFQKRKGGGGKEEMKKEKKKDSQVDMYDMWNLKERVCFSLSSAYLVLYNAEFLSPILYDLYDNC